MDRPDHPAHPLIYYENDPSRSGEVPKRLLGGSEGFLQTGGYEGYAAIGREAVHALVALDQLEHRSPAGRSAGEKA